MKTLKQINSKCQQIARNVKKIAENVNKQLKFLLKSKQTAEFRIKCR